MKSLRLKNFRNLSDTQHIEIKPITLLIGGNGSGKSSFLRFMPLLKQSYKISSAIPIVWYDKNTLDFGSFQEVVTGGDTSQDICFSFCFERESLQYLSRSDSSFYNFINHPLRLLRQADLPDIALSLEIALDKQLETENVRKLEIFLDDQHVLIECESCGDLTKFLVNHRDILTELDTQYRWRLITSGGPIPDLVFNRKLEEDANEDTDFLDLHPVMSHFLDREFRSLLTKKIKETLNLRSNTRNETLQSLVNGFTKKMGSPSVVLESYKKFALDWDKRRGSTKPKSWRNKIINWNESSEGFQIIRDFAIAAQIPSILRVCSLYLRFFSERILYLAPLRATAQRYYRYDPSMVDEVNPNGDNLAMILKSLTTKEKANFSEWTKKNFHFTVDVESNDHHVSIKIQDVKVSKKINLADTGSGFAQILPIITQLWRVINSGQVDQNRIFTIAIEQPELHLHPKFQGLLVDALINSIYVAKANNINLKLVLETHSPVFINRFGHQIANHLLKFDDVNVVIFEKDEETGNAIITTTSYDEDGLLKDWPIGFLEADLV
jgi:predicted ATPase